MTWKVAAMKANMSVGSWLTEQVSFAPRPDLTEIAEDWRMMKETVKTVEEPVKQAIEPDKTKIKDGKLRKGLGDLPGEKPSTWEDLDSFKRFTPAPKPGKK